MDKNKEYILILFVFGLGIFFSAMSLLNSKIKSGTHDKQTKKATILEFISHSFISGVISVTIFALLTHYKSDWSVILQGAIAVVGAMISDTVLERVKGDVRGK